MATEDGFVRKLGCWLVQTSNILAQAPLFLHTPLPEIAEVTI